MTGWTIHRLGVVDSTMDEARRLLAAGAAGGTALIAAQQMAGRGREGRPWVSPPGNLHLTAILHGPADPRRAAEAGFVVALAVAGAADRLAGPGTELKWPNDVMRGGAKLAGILMERDGDGTILAGIGMNCGHVPPGLPYAATSLDALGCPAEPAAAADAVLAALTSEWALWQREGFAAVLTRWRARGPALGAPLSAQVGTARLGGRFAGLRADGALLLDTPEGRRTVIAGDVRPCATPGAGTTTER